MVNLIKWIWSGIINKPLPKYRVTKHNAGGWIGAYYVIEERHLWGWDFMITWGTFKEEQLALDKIEQFKIWS